MAERVIGAIDPKIRCCMALWSSTQMRFFEGQVEQFFGFAKACDGMVNLVQVRIRLGGETQDCGAKP